MPAQSKMKALSNLSYLKGVTEGSQEIVKDRKVVIFYVDILKDLLDETIDLILEDKNE